MPDAPIAIVIPAHNEEAVIGRLLDALSDRSEEDQVVVVCDGCTDATAGIARSFPGVVVIEQDRAGKPAALNAGDNSCSTYPRFYVDGDIVVTAGALREVASMMVGGILAGAPTLSVDRTGSSWCVRRFYEVWTRLPYATDAVLGSGVIGVTAAGRARFGQFPDVIGDDEFVRRLFTVQERVPATKQNFVVTAPRRLGPLIRIKTRGRLGILQLDQIQGPAPATSGAAGSNVLWTLVRDPRDWSSLAVFLCVRALVGIRAHLRLRRAEFSVWDRDESSRSEVVA